MKQRKSGLRRFKQAKSATLKAKGLLEHYPLFEAEDSTPSEIIYIFDSDIHGRYYISFAYADHRFKTLPTFNQQVYEISFTPVTSKDRRKGEDPRIALTLVKAVEVFLESYGSPLVYVCDMDDLRHLCRARLFSKWGYRINSPLYKHESKEVEVLDSRYIFGVITFINDKYFDHYFSQIDSCREYLQ